MNERNRMERPRIKIPLTTLDYIIEILSLLSVLSAIVLYIIYWTKAPDVVPIHYNMHGEADGYGSPTVLILLPILAVIFYIGLTILNRHPHIFNFPTAVTEQNALSLYKISTRFVRWFKLLLCLLFTYEIWNEVKMVLTNQEPKLGNIIWIFITIIALCPIVPIVKMKQKKCLSNKIIC